MTVSLIATIKRDVGDVSPLQQNRRFNHRRKFTQTGRFTGRAGTETRPYGKITVLITAVISIAPGDSSQAKPVQNDRTIK